MENKLKERIKSAVNLAVLRNWYENTETGRAVPEPFEKKWQWGRLKFSYEHRSSKEFWGRFGGGWQYKIGVDIGSSTVLIHLVVSTLRIDVATPAPSPATLPVAPGATGR
jgi:hypothetical protein